VRRVVLDTSVLVSAVRSSRGASFAVLSAIGSGSFDIAVSVPLILEYEDVLLRHATAAGLATSDVADIVDYICSIAILQDIFFLWRPILRDAGDDMVLELAVAARCDAVITHNVRDFVGAERFDVAVLPPGRFLEELRGKR
jgi:putative PIN family toxin of toxin-antitoxin system